VSASPPTTFDPLDPEQRANPYPVYAAMRREAPVVYAPAYDLWVVTRYDDVLRVLKDEETFSSRNALRSSPREPLPEVRAVLAEGWPEMPIIVDSDPPLHTRIRRPITKAFTPRRGAEREPRIAAIARELVDGFAGAGEADVVEAFAWPLPLRVMGELIGVPPEDLPWLHERSRDWLGLYQATGTLDKQLAQARGTVEFQRYFVRAMEEREHAPRDDLMSALISSNAEDPEPVSLVDLAGVPLDLMVAGHVTVTRAIGSALVLLLDHPAELERLRHEPERVPGAVEEVLRLESPAQGLFRQTTRDVELGGILLPEGVRLMVHFGAANRDEAVFADADRFDADRFDAGREDVGKRHVAFGKGIHVCIGAPLARLELRVALQLLLEHLPRLRRADDGPLVFDPIFFARGLSSLRLRWEV
jgi:cytochrome P450